MNWRGMWSFVYAIEPSMDENPPWTPPDARHPKAILDIVRFLDVENTARYAKRAGWTCCTIFVSDATRLLFAEIPLDPVGPRKWYNRGANQMISWMQQVGFVRHDWRLCQDAAEAQARANHGFPTVVIAREEGSPGHVALVIPGQQNARGFPHVAQAGLVNFSAGYWENPAAQYITHP
ncbi:MAG: hypothetical protein HC915_12355 [Anaerolineae bacterium]|nr:hypothetical protein [Anaerolineae bacterium]